MNEIEELRAEVARQRSVIDALAARLDALAPVVGAAGGPTSAPRPVSRRGLLTAAVAGGAGLIATQVTTAAPAAAAPGNAVVLGANNDGVTSITAVTSDPGLNSSPFAVINPNTGGRGIGLYATLGPRTERFDGSRDQLAAVVGDSKNGSGVTGLSIDGTGVYGVSDFAGLQGRGGNYGVLGQTVETNGVGVYGGNISEVGGTGVYGSASAGTALSGNSSGGYGVQAQGGLAPLRLVPGPLAGAPKSGTHKSGELFVDRYAVLYYCLKSGTPGVWKKVTMS